MSEVEVVRKRALWTRLIFGAALIVVILYACAQNSGSAAEECRRLASDRFGGDARYNEILVANDTFVKGRIMEIRHGGNHHPAHHWECSYDSGNAVITFDSPAVG